MDVTEWHTRLKEIFGSSWGFGYTRMTKETNTEVIKITLGNSELRLIDDVLHPTISLNTFSLGEQG